MKRLLNPHRMLAGQAMAEMVLALVAMVVIMVGIVAFGEGGYLQIYSKLEALRQASVSAITGGTGSDQSLVQDWDAGRDMRNYTPDDQPIPLDSSSYYSHCQSVLSTPVQYPNYSGPNSGGLQNNFFINNPNLNNNSASTSGWAVGTDSRDMVLGEIVEHDTAGSGTRTVEFGSALQQLVYGADKISIRNEVYWPMLTGLR